MDQDGSGPGEWQLALILFDNTDPADEDSVQVGLYVKVNDKGEIQDRVVIKKITEPAGVEDDHDKEEFIMGFLPKCENIAGNRTTEKENHGGKLNVRYVYTEYAPWGDLAGLIHNYGDEPKAQIPEKFIWCVFEGLAEAIFAM